MFYRIFVFINNLILSPVYGQEDLQERFQDIRDADLENGEISDFVGLVYDFAMPLAVFCAFVLLGYGAFKLIMSTGDPEKLNEAREIITNAILGVLMIGLGIGLLYFLAEALEIPAS